MHVIVTGCAGFIGGHLSEELLRRGCRVTGIDNFLPSYEAAPRRKTVAALSAHPAFRFHEADVADVDLSSFLDDASVVYHLAAKAGVRSSWDDLDSYLHSNLLTTQRLLAAAARRKGVKVVFASSSSVYGRARRFPTLETDELHPVSPYGVTKAAGEQLVEAYRSEFGLDAVTLRYFTVYGPRQRSDMAFHIWIKAALEGRPVSVFGDGTAIRDFTYVGDVVAATTAAAALPSGTIANVAGGSPVTLREVIATIGELTGREVDITHMPIAQGDPDRTGGSTARLRTLTDWSPITSLREGLVLEIAWMVDTLRRD